MAQQNSAWDQFKIKYDAKTEDGGVARAFSDFVKAMEFFKMGERGNAWKPALPSFPPSMEWEVDWGSATPKDDTVDDDDDVEMSREEYFLVVAERQLGNYTKMERVYRHDISCRCWVKLKLEQVFDEGKPMRGHAKVCSNCGTLHYHLWDGDHK